MFNDDPKLATGNSQLTRFIIEFNHNIGTHPEYAPTLDFGTATTLGVLNKVEVPINDDHKPHLKPRL
jgi:hypothetical protein